MQAHQNIGSHNAQQGLPQERNQDTAPKSQPAIPELQHPVKPAVTNDEGNLQDDGGDQAKGYAEKKHTEAGSNEKPVGNEYAGSTAPQNQSEKTNKVYGGETEP
jgi:hypothetical protein